MLSNKKSYFKSSFYGLDHKAFHTMRLDVINGDYVKTEAVLREWITAYMNTTEASIAYITIECMQYNINGLPERRTIEYYYEW